nr:type II toxin-antitoxin system HicB family antitoxin [uncultured Acidaminococcus sp.]
MARYPDLPGCITVGCSMEEAAKNAEDAKKEWLTAALESEWRLQNQHPQTDIPGSSSCGFPKGCTAGWLNTPKKKGAA